MVHHVARVTCRLGHNSFSRRLCTFECFTTGKGQRKPETPSNSWNWTNRSVAVNFVRPFSDCSFRDRHKGFYYSRKHRYSITCRCESTESSANEDEAEVGGRARGWHHRSFFSRGGIFDAAANRSIEIDTLMSGCDLPVNIRQRGNGRDPKVGGTVTSDAILSSVSRLLTARGGIKSGTNRGHPSRLAFFPIQLAMCWWSAVYEKGKPSPEGLNKSPDWEYRRKLPLIAAPNNWSGCRNVPVNLDRKLGRLLRW